MNNLNKSKHFITIVFPFRYVMFSQDFFILEKFLFKEQMFL